MHVDSIVRTALGAELLPADSLAAAQELLVRHAQIDLVVLDLLLPECHGLMGLAQLRAEQHESIPSSWHPHARAAGVDRQSFSSVLRANRGVFALHPEIVEPRMPTCAIGP